VVSYTAFSPITMAHAAFGWLVLCCSCRQGLTLPGLIAQ